MKIKKIYLNHVTVFERFELPLCNGLNIVIGENATGKTHFLKSIYNVVHEHSDGILQKEYIRKYTYDKADIPSVMAEYEDNQKETDICWLKPDGRKLCRHNDEIIYIPVMEMLSHADGLVALYQKYNLPFEQVQIDIVLNAELPEARETAVLETKLLDTIEKVIGGKVIYKDGKFSILKEDGFQVGFEMEAEGLRKFALLWKLIRNGLIREGSILLWDEPEANINPELIPTLVDILLELQRNDVQIILATHSYNLAKYFEVKKEKKDQVQFHSFAKKDNEVIPHSSAVFGKVKSNKLIEADDTLLDLVFDKGLGD